MEKDIAGDNSSNKVKGPSSYWCFCQEMWFFFYGPTLTHMLQVLKAAEFLKVKSVWCKSSPI